MVQPKNASSKAALLVAIALFLYITVLTLRAFVIALAGINPEYHDMQLVYPVSEDTAGKIWSLNLLAILASVIITIFAALNFKFKSLTIKRLTLVACGILIAWAAFATWALNGEYAAEGSIQNSSGQNSNRDDLQIRSVNFD